MVIAKQGVKRKLSHLIFQFPNDLLDHPRSLTTYDLYSRLHSIDDANLRYLHVHFPLVHNYSYRYHLVSRHFSTFIQD